MDTRRGRSSAAATDPTTPSEAWERVALHQEGDEVSADSGEREAISLS